MVNTQPTKTGNEQESKVDISGDSTLSSQPATMEQSESMNLSANTNADTPNDSIKTWTNAELEKLRLKAGLVAGALSEFQDAKGLVAVSEIEYTAPSGSKYTAVKIILVAENLNVKKVATPDGIDLDLQSLGKESK